MKILVCGSRTMPIDLLPLVKTTLQSLNPTTIIQGGAIGADNLAKLVAIELGYEIQEYPANWQLYGRSAGPIRNQLMLDEGKPDLVLAFHPTSGITKGTKDMVQRAKNHKVPVKIVTYEVS